MLDARETIDPPKSDSSSLGVHGGRLKTEGLDDHERLRSEGLVELPNVDVFLGNAEALVEGGNGVGGSDTFEKGETSAFALSISQRAPANP
jgi:hypothetical protein